MGGKALKHYIKRKESMFDCLLVGAMHQAFPTSNLLNPPFPFVTQGSLYSG